VDEEEFSIMKLSSKKLGMTSSSQTSNEFQTELKEKEDARGVNN